MLEMASHGVARVPAGRSRRAVWGSVKEQRAEAMLEALRRWAAEHGEPPTLADWEPSRARRQGQEWRAERWEAGDWPSSRMVRNHFGTMSAAVRAAGLIPRRSSSRVETAGPSPWPRGASPSPQPAGEEEAPRSRQQQVLALRVRSVAQAASRDDPRLLAEALSDLAMAALSWSDEIRSAVEATTAKTS